MKLRQKTMQLSALAVAVTLAMSTFAVRAEDDEALALKLPTNTIELGAVNVSGDTGKFGEYTGLNKNAGPLVGNINVRGGAGYVNNAQGETQRWSIKANDIGLTSNSFKADASDQGVWTFGIGYDELKHNLSDTYQTPYIGNMGGNLYTLPSNFGLVTTAGTGVPGTNNLSPAQLAAFHNLDISTTRRNTSLQAGMNIDSRWSLGVDYNRLDQSGAKLMGFGSAGVGGAAGEVVSILPMPTNYKTDTVSLALNWRGDKAHFSSAYFGSFFRNGYDRVNFQTYAGASQMQPMTTAPNNDFNQLNLSGGYALAPKTKLTGSLSYARNTQNAAFVAPEAGIMVTPLTQSSLNGQVINTHADLKLMDQTTQQLSLTGAFKYDERDNQTASNLYNFNAISGGNTAYYPNTPLSNKKAQLELAGDYRFKAGQSMRLSYVHEDINRWCHQYAVGASYPAGTNCVVAKASKDDRLDATYRLKLNEEVDFKVGYGYSDRHATTDPFALAALISKNGAVPGPVPATNLTPMGQNAGDYYGFYPFFEASRQQQLVKGSVNWQATDLFAMGLSGRYSKDQYGSTYGVQNGNTWSLNLDATFNYQENGSVYSFVTQQNRQRDLTDAQRSTVTASAASATAIAIPAVATWTNKLTDQDTTVGLGVKQTGLLGGKLDLSGDLTYATGAGVYSTALNYATATTGGLTCSSAAILSCGQLPDIKSTMSQFKLTAGYQVDKSTKVMLRYVYQHLTSSDYYYNGYQYGYSPSGLMPTNQLAPNYSVNAVAVSLIHNF